MRLLDGVAVDGMDARAHASTHARAVATCVDAGQVAARALRRVRLEAQSRLKTCGYIIKKEVRFIPISGLTETNVLKKSM